MNPSADAGTPPRIKRAATPSRSLSKPPSATQRTLDLLAAYESRNVTHVDAERGWPIVWRRARGSYVWDVEGRRYLDLTAAFGVSAAGHANPRVVRAGQRQMAVLLHAMGDVHPHPGKAELARALSAITFERWSPPGSLHHGFRGKVILGSSGFEAVEAALKTALLATGRAEIVAFEQAYHGLGYGALNATSRDHFRGPFRPQLRQFAHFLPYPVDETGLEQVKRLLRQRLRRGRTGAVLVEPIQARGGIRIPAPGFLPLLRQACESAGALLILDEIYTGFGRTGTWFACEHEGVRPDLLCLGKAMAGGFPISACVGRADLMDAAWPASTGEAIHTSTFLGHPVGCAMALAQIQELRERSLVDRSAQMGAHLATQLNALAESRPFVRTRNRGLMGGIEILDRPGLSASQASMDIVHRMLERGFLLLPEGPRGEVISLTPPLTISRGALDSALQALSELLTSRP
jgi:4-aminobutyrate aminotransferase-like enzyme